MIEDAIASDFVNLLRPSFAEALEGKQGFEGQSYVGQESYGGQVNRLNLVNFLRL